jgi:3-hydroxyisobutyrate dehydrogenase-like beta-hydroxyacid dehydrogenase
MKVGFIGLGGMGSAMAQNLIKAGFATIVYNRTRSRSEELRPLGATVAETSSQAASNADILITMVADDRALEDVILGSGNAIQSLRAGATHISMSTISVALSRQLADAHRERKQNYIAAPVFGRPEAAVAAKLFIVAAGPRQQLETCQPLFDAMGQKTFVADGDAPSANVIKLLGNFLIASVLESLAEAFVLARKSGIEVNNFLDILTGTLFNAPIYKTYGGLIAQEKFEPAGFKLLLGLKDCRLVLAAAEEAAVPMPIASLIRDHFLTAVAQGMGEIDWSAISRVSARNAGL